MRDGHEGLTPEKKEGFTDMHQEGLAGQRVALLSLTVSGGYTCVYACKSSGTLEHDNPKCEQEKNLESFYYQVELTHFIMSCSSSDCKEYLVFFSEYFFLTAPLRENFPPVPKRILT